MTYTEVAVRDTKKGKKYLTVLGVEVGPLFVHRTLSSVRNPGWTITHIRSGYAVIASLPTRRKAIEVADRLSRLNGWDGDERGIQDNRILKRNIIDILWTFGIYVG